MAHKCSILFPQYSACEPKDISGCIKENGHLDAHLFKATDGRFIEWEYDDECDCDSCLNDEDGQCIIYDEVNPTTTP